MKNYYEILEVNKNASTEVIDKAHKTLVKKYHPDLQENTQQKANSEAKIKEINEAYEVLGNSEKRAEYDAMLAEQETIEQERIIQEQLEKELRNNSVSNNNYRNDDYYNQQNKNSYTNKNNIRNQQVYNNKTNNSNNYNDTINEQFQQDYEDAINKAYHDAYIQDMKNRGYKIKYKKTWNERLRSLIALLITIGIILLIFQLPFVKDYFHSLYKENEVFRNIINFFGGWFN